MAIRACIFDAYGTLFDVHSVVRIAAQAIPGDLAALSRLWRQKQVEYTWRRTLMQRYEDFWHVTEAALHAAVTELGIAATPEQLARLMQAYLAPLAFPEVAAVLDALAPRPLAILSNGSPSMLEAAVRAAGLEERFAHVLSVDTIRIYKPAPEVYALGPRALGIPAREILFVSSNSWDAAGAKAFGYTVCWCNRAGGAPDDMGFPPDFTVARLDEIPALL